MPGLVLSGRQRQGKATGTKASLDEDGEMHGVYKCAGQGEKVLSGGLIVKTCRRLEIHSTVYGIRSKLISDSVSRIYPVNFPGTARHTYGSTKIYISGE